MASASLKVAAPSLSSGGAGSWLRVANGLRLVAQAGASRATTEVSKQGQLALGHALQMMESAQKSSQQQQQQQESSWTVPGEQSSFAETSFIKTDHLDTTSPTNLNSVSAASVTTPPPVTTADAVVDSASAPTTSIKTTTTTTSPSNATAASAPTTTITSSSTTAQNYDELDLLEEGRAVPSTRVGRAFGFAKLGVGLAMGTAAEGISRLVGNSSSDGGSVALNDQNADRLAASLCRMRGAALKMGQMLSIQDESLLPPALTRALNQVRQGAEAMPARQLQAQLQREFGDNWREKFVSFEDRPFAAASVGQVHRAKIVSDDDPDGSVRDVVVKVQYPGVASSIESDLRNLGMLVQWSGFSPPGLFLENVIRVGSKEMIVECNYLNELEHQRRIRELVHADDFLHNQNKFVVPDVVAELTTDSIITSEYLLGGTIDKVSNLHQEERNRIGRAIMYLTMHELFVWRFMQTDPNWGNFLYNVGTGSTGLIDFGACRDYSKDFVDGYLRIVWASANRDEKTLMEQSRRMHFLTGNENAQMLEAHKRSGFTVGEPFYSSSDSLSPSTSSSDDDIPAFDFRGSNISTRMGEQTAVFMQHRLTAPPEEVYTLHRKLAGAYMLCIKLGAVIPCRDLLRDIVVNYEFDDGLPHPIHG